MSLEAEAWFNNFNFMCARRARLPFSQLYWQVYSQRAMNVHCCCCRFTFYDQRNDMMEGYEQPMARRCGNEPTWFMCRECYGSWNRHVGMCNFCLRSKRTDMIAFLRDDLRPIIRQTFLHPSSAFWIQPISVLILQYWINPRSWTFFAPDMNVWLRILSPPVYHRFIENTHKLSHRTVYLTNSTRRRQRRYKQQILFSS